MRSLFAMRRAWRSSVQTRDARWLGDRIDLSLRCEPEGDLEGEMGTMPSSSHKIAAQILIIVGIISPPPPLQPSKPIRLILVDPYPYP